MTAPKPAPADAAGAGKLDPLKLPPESWRPSSANDQRRSDRIGEREIERLTVSMRRGDESEWNPVRIRDYSNLGFGIHQVETPAKPLALAGDKVELRISLDDRGEIIVPCVVQNIQYVGDEIRLGLARKDILPEQDDGSQGLSLETASQPTVRVANPLLYNEWSDAALTGFGTEGEWIFQSMDSDLLLFRQLPIHLLFDLPLEGDGECFGIIMWSRFDPEHRLTFGVKWTSMSFEVSNAVGEHLLNSVACKPRDLVRYGIRLKRFKDQLRFAVTSTQEEYERVLSLRRQAYVQAGKVQEKVAPEQLASRFDGHSRILAAFHGEALVASVGLTFARDDASPLRSEGEFPNMVYPVALPPKTTMIEVHSLCTRSDYRGGDLIRGMFEQIARCLLLSDRDWFITLTTEELWPLYRKIGFRKVGASVKVKALNDLPHHLILMHRGSLSFGRGMTRMAWNYFFGDLVRDLLEKRYLVVPAWQRLLILGNALFAQVTRRWSDRKLEVEFQAFLGRNASRGKNHD